MIATVHTDPKNGARHAREYQALKHWFQRRIHELGLDRLEEGDPMDPHHPFNQAFDALCKEAQSLWWQTRRYVPSPLQLSHAFFQMDDPIKTDEMTA